MMKRCLPIALVAMLVMALALPTAASPFGDVPQTHWAYEAVKQLAAYGIIEGFPDGTFKGAEPLTRYQMAMVIARVLVSLDAQIKAEIEAAKAGLAPAPAPAPVEKVIEKETVTVEKPVVEKVVEREIVEKLKTEELDALAARLAGIEGRVGTVEGKVAGAEGQIGAVEGRVGAVEGELAGIEGRLTTAEGALAEVSGKVDVLDRKGDEISAKVIQLDGALALLEGEFSVELLELETKLGASDADLADQIAALEAEMAAKVAAGDTAGANQLAAAKAELEAKIAAGDKELASMVAAMKAELAAKLADGDSALNAKIEAKAKELIGLIDALRTEFSLELTALGVRVAALEEQLAMVNARIDELDAKVDAKIAALQGQVGTLDTKIVGVDQKATEIGSKLDTHVAGHEKVTISGSSEVKLEDVDIYAPWDIAWDDEEEEWTGSKAWKDPNDIFDADDDDIHSDGAYYPTSTFEHKLDLTLTARPAEGVAVNIGIGTLKNLFAGTDVTDFQLSELSLEVVTPGVLASLFAGGVVLPEGTFTPYTLTADQFLDDDDEPIYEGVVGQLAFGKYSGTVLFLRPGDDVPGDPPTMAEYIAAGEGKVALTENLKLGAAYVTWFDDPQSATVDDPEIPNDFDAMKDNVVSVYGSMAIAPGWSVSGEFAKASEFDDAVLTQTGTAMKLDLTGKVSALELEANLTRVEDTFEPDLVNLDPDDGGIATDVRSASISGTLPLGNLTLTGGYKVSGDADAAGDWDEKRTNTATAGASYAMEWGAMSVTPSVDVENKLYVLGNTVYGENGNVVKVTGGVKAELAPITAEYKVTGATKRAGAGAPEPYYAKSVFDLGLDYQMTPNLALTGGYNWTRLDDKVDVVEDDGDPYNVVDTNTTVVKAGVAAELPLSETTKVTGSYNYEGKSDLLDNYKPYTKSIFKTGFSSQLTPKASVAASAEFAKLDRWEDAVTRYEYAPLSNLIASVDYTYNIATNTTLGLGYKVVKSDMTEGDDSLVDYTARIISGSLKVTF